MVYVWITLGIFLMETAIKYYMENTFSFGQKMDILNGRVTIHKLHNKGAFLGFLNNKPKVLKCISGFLVVLMVLSYRMFFKGKGKPLTKIGCTLLMAGAGSNLYDRFHRGYVVDYFSLRIKPIRNVVFNLSDFFIFIGSLFLLIFGGKSVSR